MSKNPDLDRIDQIQKDLRESREIVAKAMGQAKALMNVQSYDIPVGQASPATGAVPTLVVANTSHIQQLMSQGQNLTGDIGEATARAEAMLVAAEAAGDALMQELNTRLMLKEMMESEQLAQDLKKRAKEFESDMEEVTKKAAEISGEYFDKVADEIAAQNNASDPNQNDPSQTNTSAPPGWNAQPSKGATEPPQNAISESEKLKALSQGVTKVSQDSKEVDKEASQKFNK